MIWFGKEKIVKESWDFEKIENRLVGKGERQSKTSVLKKIKHKTGVKKEIKLFYVLGQQKYHKYFSFLNTE